MAMEDLQKFNQEKLKIISEFDKEQLMVYIDKLTMKYYTNYIKGDVDNCKAIKSSLDDIILMFEDTMEYLYHYINLSMVKSANLVLKSVFKNDYVFTGYDVELELTNPTYSLHAAIRNSLNLKIDSVDKVNINKLHDICSNNKDIDAEIVAISDALYKSFVEKDGDADDD